MVKKSSIDSKEISDTALTETQSEVLKFIRATCEATGVSPSYREIQNHFGYKAIGTVQDHVKMLIKKGHLESSRSDTRRARGLLPKGFRTEGVTQIPIYGEIAAGPTRDSVQLELGTLTIPVTMSKSPCFGLRVVGDSMQDIGILEGDVLVVQRQNRASSGDIVVALLNGETTVKRYVQKNEKIFLVPENKRLKPLEVVQGDFQIQGKVIGLQRRF
jgi:repressor LexA